MILHGLDAILGYLKCDEVTLHAMRQQGLAVLVEGDKMMMTTGAVDQWLLEQARCMRFDGSKER